MDAVARTAERRMRMVNVKLYEFGVDNTLREISGYLKGAIGDNISKKRKDEAICKAFGAVETLFNIIQIEEVKDEEVMNHKAE